MFKERIWVLFLFSVIVDSEISKNSQGDRYAKFLKKFENHCAERIGKWYVMKNVAQRWKYLLDDNIIYFLANRKQ